MKWLSRILFCHVLGKPRRNGCFLTAHVCFLRSLPKRSWLRFHSSNGRGSRRWKENVDGESGQQEQTKNLRVKTTKAGTFMVRGDALGEAAGPFQLGSADVASN